MDLFVSSFFCKDDGSFGRPHPIKALLYAAETKPLQSKPVVAGTFFDPFADEMLFANLAFFCVQGECTRAIMYLGESHDWIFIMACLLKNGKGAIHFLIIKEIASAKLSHQSNCK